MNRDEIIERAARVLSTLTTCDGHPHATELHRRQARALADAGLLARPAPTRDEIEQAVHDSADFLDWETCLEIADAVLALLKGQEA